MSLNTRSTWRETPPVLARADCTICGGTGWELLEIGGTAGARRCACGSLDRLLRLRESLHVPRQYEDCSLANYQPRTEAQARALEQMHRFADRYPRLSRDLFLSGPSGTGKTHLVVGLLRELMQRFHDGDIRFADFQDLIQFYLQACDGNDSGVKGWKSIVEMPLLVIDGFGYESPSHRVIQLTEDLLDARRASGRRTILTGDRFKFTELLIPDARMRSFRSATQDLLLGLRNRTVTRLLSNVKLVRLDGEDYRLKAGAERILF